MRTTRRGRAALSAAALGLLLLAGCRSPESSKPESEGVASPPPDAPAFAPRWDAAVDAQALRLERLAQVYASGQVEVTWSDARGSHFEFCRGELFLRLPSETGLSLTKVGERLLWLGSDRAERWLFDLQAKEPTLWVVAAETETSAMLADLPVPLHRLSLIDLLGLMPLPPADALDAILDAEPGALVGEFTGDAGTIRATLDALTGLPRRIEAIDDAGRPFVRAELGGYEPVERPGLPPPALPRFPTRVVVTTLDPETPSAASANVLTLFLTPSPRGESRIADRFFQRTWLEETFKPVRVERPAPLRRPAEGGDATTG